MKKSIITLTLACLLPFVGTGCKTRASNLVLLNTGVSAVTTATLLKYPPIRPEIAVAAAVICASAQGTNASPEALRNALGQSQWSDQSLVILSASLNLFSLATANLSNQEAYRPYAQAVCDGLNFGLAITEINTAPSVARSPKAAEALGVPLRYAEKFPQLK